MAKRPGNIFFGFGGSGSGEVNPTPVPTAYYTADTGSGTTLFDSVGTNDGTLVNGTTWEPGVIGTGLGFDGVNDYVNIPDSADLDITGDMSVNFLFKPSAFPANPVFLSKFDGSDQAYNFFYNNSINKLGYYSSAGQEAVYSVAVTVNTGTFYMFTYIRSGTQILFYLNATQVGSATITNPQTQNNGSVNIGQSGAGTDYINGVIDEMAIYKNVVLTQADLDYMWNGGDYRRPNLS